MAVHGFLLFQQKPPTRTTKMSCPHPRLPLHVLGSENDDLNLHRLELSNSLTTDVQQLANDGRTATEEHELLLCLYT